MYQRVFNYEATLVPESAWKRLDANVRNKGMWVLWAITWAGLAAGLFDRAYWEAVVWFSVGHAMVATALVGFRPVVFPAQLRIAYAGWVALGTFVPAMTWMMYVTLAGLLSNLVVGWCPLARMLHLLPWNRQEAFSGSLVFRTFFSKPRPGRFVAPPPKSAVRKEASL